MSSKSTIEQLFSTLEQAAFKGEWDDESQRLLLKESGMDSSDWKDTSKSPYHARYQKLCAAASILTSTRISPEEYGPVKDYLRLYPGSRKHVPRGLLQILEDPEKGGS